LALGPTKREKRSGCRIAAFDAATCVHRQTQHCRFSASLPQARFSERRTIMFRTSGIGAEIVEHLLDRPMFFTFRFRHAVLAAAPDRAAEPSQNGAPHQEFTHAVMEFAALSLSARSILALRG
jgi:hypothetical protein